MAWLPNRRGAKALAVGAVLALGAPGCSDRSAAEAAGGETDGSDGGSGQVSGMPPSDVPQDDAAPTWHPPNCASGVPFGQLCVSEAAATWDDPPAGRMIQPGSRPFSLVVHETGELVGLTGPLGQLEGFERDVRPDDIDQDGRNEFASLLDPQLPGQPQRVRVYRASDDAPDGPQDFVAETYELPWAAPVGEIFITQGFAFGQLGVAASVDGALELAQLEDGALVVVRSWPFDWPVVLFHRGIVGVQTSGPIELYRAAFLETWQLELELWSSPFHITPIARPNRPAALAVLEAPPCTLAVDCPPMPGLIAFGDPTRIVGGAPQTLRVQPSDISATDLTGDGELDLVVAASTEDGELVLAALCIDEAEGQTYACGQVAVPGPGSISTFAALDTPDGVGLVAISRSADGARSFTAFRGTWAE